MIKRSDLPRCLHVGDYVLFTERRHVRHDEAVDDDVYEDVALAGHVAARPTKGRPNSVTVICAGDRRPASVHDVKLSRITHVLAAVAHDDEETEGRPR